MERAAEAVSRDPAVVTAYVDDPLVTNAKVSARTAHEMFTSVAGYRDKAPTMMVPVLIQHGEAVDLALDEFARESVDSGRHGGVRGEDRARAYRFECGVEVETTHHELTHALEPEEAGMTLVGVEDLRSRVARDLAVAAQGSHTATTG